MNCRAVLDSWNSAPASKNALVSPSKSEKWVCMPEPGVVRERLGHERGVGALLEGDFLDDRAERHDVIRGLEGIGVTEVNLVLARTALVMAELHRDTDRFEHGHGGAAEVLRYSARYVVKVATFVHRNRSPPVRAQFLRLQQVELDLGMGVAGEAHVRGLREGPLEDVAGGPRQTVHHPE